MLRCGSRGHGRSQQVTDRQSVPAGRRGLHLGPGIRNSGPPLRAAGARSSPLCQSGPAVKLGGGNREGAPPGLIGAPCLRWHTRPPAPHARGVAQGVHHGAWPPAGGSRASLARMVPAHVSLVRGMPWLHSDRRADRCGRAAPRPGPARSPPSTAGRPRLSVGLRCRLTSGQMSVRLHCRGPAVATGGHWSTGGRPPRLELELTRQRSESNG